ncbi:MAG: hypothetical protein JXQ91_09590 [Vannielia sp.]|uniref:lipopolysaccharide biosynthesis protein n=1 Tax=Vannielia sp. TaxID=2813045 RepID=UPI003B8CCDC7
MPDQNTTSRIVKGSGAQALTFGVRLAEQFLLVPIFLAAWSTELYGEWLILTAVPIYLSLSDMGFVTAGSNELARRSEGRVNDAVRNFYRAYVSIFLQWSLVIFACVLGVVAILPLSDAFNLNLISNGEAAQVFLILVASALLSQNGLTLIAGMRATGSFHVAISMRAVFGLVKLAVVAFVLLALGGRPSEVAIATFVVQLLEPLVLGVLLSRRGLAPGWNLLRKPQPEMWHLLGLGLGFMLMPVAQAVVLQGMVLLMGSVLGATAAAIYATHRTLTRTTAQITQLGVSPLRAELGLQQAEQKREQVRALLIRATALTFWASLTVAACLMVVGKPLYETWTHGEIAFHALLFGLLLGATLLEGLWRMAATFRLGSNRHGPLARGYMAISIVGVGMAWLLVEQTGLWGAGLSVMLIDAAMLAIVVSLNRGVLNLRVRDFLLGTLRFPARDIVILLRRVGKRVTG